MTAAETAVYLPHPMGVRCPDPCCKQSAHEGRPLRHSGLCDLLPKRTEVARVGAVVGAGTTKGASPKADARETRNADPLREINAAIHRIKNGQATEQDLRDAATGSLRGLVTDSDAMNQDF